MAIIYYKFKTPVHVGDASQIDLESSLLFATARDIPADYSIDITPEGYRDKYTLQTKTDPSSIREDTIARIKVVRESGKKVSAFSFSPEGYGPTPIETETKESFFTIDASNSTFLLARPNALDGGEGIRVDGVVRYERS
ncbi:hypothetical protein JW887_00130 [Candidatus Dojkabacteria bacterium]|nr:hypothetical protein [Candidatus Dojkabacteria bacterium]